MKHLKSLATLAIVVAMFLTMVFVGLGQAADQTLSGTISDLVFKMDKNGNPYSRAIVQAEFELNGVKYTKGAVVMDFGEGSPFEAMEKGQKVNLIVEPNEYRGRTNYRLLSVIPEN